MKISKFNINRSKSNLSFKSVSYVSDGLMTYNDYNNLHSIENMSGKNIEQINITGPDMTTITPKITDAKQKLANQNDTLNRLYYLTESQGYCGRVWDESNSSPVAKTYCGNLTMLQQLPELLGLGGYLVQNDHTRRKLSPSNHYFFEDGSEAKLDGSMGHYQWGWNRPFYITIWRENNLHYECVSFEPIKGRESYYVPIGSMSCAGHAAIDRETKTLVSYVNDSPRYRGGENNAEWDNENRTLLGRCVTTLRTTEFIEVSRKNGTGWYSANMRMSNVLAILFHIIMGTRNSQSDFNPIKNSDGLYECGLGRGVDNINWQKLLIYNGSNPFLSTSECIELGDYTGTSEEKEYLLDDEICRFKIPIFFGLKNLYAYVWRMSEDEFVKFDLNTDITTHYIRKSMTDPNYEHGVINDSVLGNEYRIPDSESDFIKNVSYKNFELFPIELDGSKETFYTDFYHKSRNNFLRYCMRGGACRFDLFDGVLTLAVDSRVNTHQQNIGTYLCEFTEDFLLEPIIT